VIAATTAALAFKPETAGYSVSGLICNYSPLCGVVTRV
jgi:hypothetical protein